MGAADEDLRDEEGEGPGGDGHEEDGVDEAEGRRDEDAAVEKEDGEFDYPVRGFFDDVLGVDGLYGRGSWLVVASVVTGCRVVLGCSLWWVAWLTFNVLVVRVSIMGLPSGVSGVWPPNPPRTVAEVMRRGQLGCVPHHPECRYTPMT